MKLVDRHFIHVSLLLTFGLVSDVFLIETLSVTSNTEDELDRGGGSSICWV